MDEGASMSGTTSGGSRRSGGDPRAAWMLMDIEGWTASWRRVEYPIERAAQAIEKAGLPPVLGERLYTGQ